MGKSALPSIQSLSACPHCGGDEFYVVETYSGRSNYFRRFDKGQAYNGHMYDSLNSKAGKRAFCAACDKPIAKWDEGVDSPAYCEQNQAVKPC